MKFYHYVSVCLLLLESLSSLPENVFWDNDWPSDLTSGGEKDDEVGKELDFKPLENPYIIQGQSSLSSMDAEKLEEIYNENTHNDGIEVKTWNGSWISEVHLPEASKVPNLSEFQLTCGSGWGVKVSYNGGATQTVSYGNQLILAVVNGAWIKEDEYNPTPNPTAAPTKASENDNPPLLEGTVLFAQSQIMPSKHGIEGDTQPHLTALRETLVMFRPKDYNAEGLSSIEMTVRNGEGTVISGPEPLLMNIPEEIPKQEGWIELGGEVPNFPPVLTNPYVVQYQNNLNKIGNDPDSVELIEILNTPNRKNVEVKTWNGSWIGNIYLPAGSTIPEDSKIQVTCNSGYNVNIYYPNTSTGGWRRRSVTYGSKVVWVLAKSGTWVTEGDLAHNEYVFGHGFYTATLSKNWVLPGMSLEFLTIQDQENKIGILDDIDIGGVTELVITTLDAGFLTEPRDQFTFQKDPSLHREYFETAPLSRLVVVEYETLHLTEVMLPTGKLYKTVSDDNGGWHSGDMRQHTGKILLSHGIDLANYGISSSWAQSESPHPFTCAFLAAHNTVGMYQNGRQVHGGSGGNGMITLDASVGNEFSHEVGHNYGLGHYPGGFEGSVHRPPNKINSSWGWDSKTNLFFPNFSPNDTGKDQCLDDKCQSPFLGKYKYGTDSMGGGYPQWGNRFTMYTPYVTRKIQLNLESKAVWDPTSSTGFRKYDPSTKQMKEFTNTANGGKVPRLYRVPVTTIVGYYDPNQGRSLQSYVFPALHGAYGFVYPDDGGSGDGSTYGCELVVKTNKAGSLVFELMTTIDSKGMNKFHVNVATEDQPYEALVYCQSELQANRDLDGPKGDLTYTINGIPFEDDNSPTVNPTPYPTTANPTPNPTTANPTSSPTAAVTAAPSMAPADCKDDENFRYKNKKNKNCKWVGKGVEKKVKRKCKKKHDEIPVYEWCPTTCGKVGLGECKA